MTDITETSQTVAAGQLRAIIERIERVEEEIHTLNADKSEIYKEARGVGFDVKAIRQCVAARKLDSAEREERNAIFDLYWSALNGSSHVHVHEGRNSTVLDRNGTNRENGDVDGGAERAGRGGHPFDEPLPWQVETRDSDKVVDGNAPLAARGGEKSLHSNSVPHSSAPTSSPETTDKPEAAAHASGAPFTRSATLAGPDGDPSTPSPEADGAKMDGAVTPHPDRAAQADTIRVNSEQAVTDSNEDVPAFLMKERKPLRPHCQSPAECAGYGTKTCHRCLTAAGVAA